MKLSDYSKSYAANPSLKAKLKKTIKVDGVAFKRGTVSDLLILKDDGTYHFETGDTAFSVFQEEISMINKHEL